MLFKTRGIVLGHVGYKESSIICKIYTEAYGLRSYIINGAQTTKKSNKIAYFQNLNILDLVVYENEKRDIQRISEMQMSYGYRTIPFQQKKSVIAMFITELLIKSLKEESENQVKFEFLVEELISLDQASANTENFHLYFMLKLSAFLGFAPSDISDFTQNGILIPSTLEDALQKLIQLEKPELNGIKRTEILQLLIKYYQYHLDNFGNFKSIDVLRNVLHS